MEFILNFNYGGLTILNLSEKQAQDFAHLIDKISSDAKVVKSKASVKA
jgi:hypothetical protein